MVDTRLLGRPDIYHGDATKWRDWKLVFTAFCGAVNTRMEELMTEVATDSVRKTNEERSAEDRQISIQLSFMLSLLLRGQALDKIRNSVEPRNGLETWRLLSHEYEPLVRARFGGMLAALLRRTFDGTGPGEFDTFDADVKLYQDQSLQQIQDATKMAVVLNGLRNEKLREHLQLNSDKYDTYKDMRQ